MLKIYRDAVKVLIWLGQSNVESERAFDVLELELELSRETRQCSVIDSLTSIEEGDFKALQATFRERPWWTGMWIIQEAVFTRTAMLICGQRSIGWKLL